MSRQRLDLRLNLSVALVALVVSVIDALTKAWARHALAREPVHVVGALWLRLQFNSGISFSIDQSSAAWTTVVTIVVALVVVVFGLRAVSGAPTIGFGLLIGGGVANAIDRLAATPHRVTDFIAVGSFPVFNVADVSITVGFVVLIIAALRGDRLVRR